MMMMMMMVVVVMNVEKASQGVGVAGRVAAAEERVEKMAMPFARQLARKMGSQGERGCPHFNPKKLGL